MLVASEVPEPDKIYCATEVSGGDSSQRATPINKASASRWPSCSSAGSFVETYSVTTSSPDPDAQERNTELAGNTSRPCSVPACNTDTHTRICRSIRTSQRPGLAWS